MGMRGDKGSTGPKGLKGNSGDEGDIGERVCTQAYHHTSTQIMIGCARC